MVLLVVVAVVDVEIVNTSVYVNICNPAVFLEN